MEHRLFEIERGEHVLVEVATRQFDEAFEHDDPDGVVPFLPALHEADEADALAARGGERLGIGRCPCRAIAQSFRRQPMRELEAEELLGLGVEARALAVDLPVRREGMPRPQFLGERAVVPLDVGIGVGAVRRGKQRGDVAVQHKLEEAAHHRRVLPAAAEGHGVVDAQHLRDRMVGPERAQPGDRLLRRFVQRTPDLVDFEPLVVAGGEDRDRLGRPVNVLLAHKIARLVDAAQPHDCLDREAPLLDRVVSGGAFLGAVGLQPRLAHALADEPQRGHGCVRIAFGVVHLHVRCPLEILPPIDTLPLEPNHPPAHILAVAAEPPLAPSTTFPILRLLEPIHQCRPTHIEPPRDLGDTDALALERYRLRELFWLRLASSRNPPQQSHRVNA